MGSLPLSISTQRVQPILAIFPSPVRATPAPPRYAEARVVANFNRTYSNSCRLIAGGSAVVNTELFIEEMMASTQ